MMHVHILSGVACLLLASIWVSAHADVERGVSCRTPSPKDEGFSAEKIYANSVIAVEKGDEAYPINLVLYRPDGSRCRRIVVAKYPREGSDPVVDSLFFFKINGQMNLLSIVHWDVNSRGLGTYGRFYQVYAYKNDDKLDMLFENNVIESNSMLRGMDGYEDGKSIVFAYKTADSVKRFLRK